MESREELGISAKSPKVLSVKYLTNKEQMRDTKKDKYNDQCKNGLGTVTKVPSKCIVYLHRTSLEEIAGNRMNNRVEKAKDSAKKSLKKANNKIGEKNLKSTDENEKVHYKETSVGSVVDNVGGSTDLEGNFKEIAHEVLTKKFACKLCNKSFSRNHNLTMHMYRHKVSTTEKCKICSKSFKGAIHLAKHMDYIHNDSSQVYPCDSCDKQFKSKAGLRRHTIIKHTVGYRYSCDQCNSKFKHKEYYSIHMKTHTTAPCICDICGKVCPNSVAFNQHKHKKHTMKIRRFKCETCNRWFMTEKNRNSHRETHKINYACEQCGKKFKIRDYLTKHLRVHSRGKAHMCPICDKSFTLLGSQQVHLLKHVGARPHVCDICDQTFTQRSPMLLHRKKLHPEITEPPPPPVQISALLSGLWDKITDISKN